MDNNGQSDIFLNTNNMRSTLTEVKLENPYPFLGKHTNIIMKSTLDQINDKSDYPYLGKHRHSNLVVLFTADSIGIVVREGDDKRLGHFGDDWYMGVFTKLASGSKIVLEQE